MTLQELKNERLRRYLEAEQAVLINQNYTMDGRIYTRADLDIIRKVIEGLLEDGAVLDGMETQKPDRIRRVVFKDW